MFAMVLICFEMVNFSCENGMFCNDLVFVQYPRGFYEHVLVTRMRGLFRLDSRCNRGARLWLRG
jgi:hypothetical protein